MGLPINFNPPRIMHVDLNTCFAIIEKQSNPLIRHKPVAIAAYDTPRSAVIASSPEAEKICIEQVKRVRDLFIGLKYGAETLALSYQ